MSAATPSAAAPPVTVVIPTRGRPATLLRAIRSVHAQTSGPLEIGVVIDGPDAATEAALAPLEGPLLRVVRLPDSGGPGRARNVGAAAGRAHWVAFLDDDDEWLPTYLATAVARVAAERLDLLCTDLLYRYDDERGERPGKNAPDGLDVQFFLTRNPGLIGSNLIITTASYAAIGGFDESLQTSEDMDFGIRLSLRGGFRYAPLRERLVRHHQHGRPRLCTRRGDAMRAGVARFFALHGARMSAAQREQFGEAIRTLWGVDELGRDWEAPA